MWVRRFRPFVVHRVAVFQTFDLSADRVQNTSARRDPHPSGSPALRNPSAMRAATSGDIPLATSRITAATVGSG